MTANFFGMEIDAVRQLATQLQRASDEIEQIMTRLTPEVTNQSIWRGPDADRFRNDWQSTHVPALRNVAQALGTASTTATTNADQQQSTSQ